MDYNKKHHTEIACNPTRFKKDITLNITTIDLDMNEIIIDGVEQPDDEPLGIMICSSDNNECHNTK